MPRSLRPRGSSLPYLLIVLTIVIMGGGWVLYSRMQTPTPVKFVVVESRVPSPDTLVISPLSGKPHPLSEYRVDIENPNRVICPDTHKTFSRKRLIALAIATTRPADPTTAPR